MLIYRFLLFATHTACGLDGTFCIQGRVHLKPCLWVPLCTGRSHSQRDAEECNLAVSQIAADRIRLHQTTFRGEINASAFRNAINLFLRYNRTHAVMACVQRYFLSEKRPFQLTRRSSAKYRCHSSVRCLGALSNLPGNVTPECEAVRGLVTAGATSAEDECARRPTRVATHAFACVW